ncbi:MAG: phosphodiester glycosidase family protein [Clostridiales bacterium]|nr:phosphodiester glycosidase family protein [Clostridiales bacterium]
MNRIRWIIAILLLLALALGLACPSIVEAEGAKLPMDYTKGGVKTTEENWSYDGKLPVAYKDSTIEVTSESGQVVLPALAKRPKGVKHETWVIRIRIQDASQLRTAVSKDTYNGRGQAKGEDIAKSKNAVAAMNGDFFKYENDVGYVVRQGEFIRDATDTTRKKKGQPICFDMLVVDSEGDFHVIPRARTKEIEAFIETELAPEGKTVMDTFNLGPALVINGEVQDIASSQAAQQGDYQWNYPQQRIALVQTGHLEYAIVEVYGKTDGTAGMSLDEFAALIAEKVPDAIIAYNFDGGGSTNLIMNNKRICKTPGLREITDIIYFASAEGYAEE